MSDPEPIGNRLGTHGAPLVAPAETAEEEEPNRQLIKCIADRNFVCVVGSGVSASARNGAGDRPPGWVSLIKELADDVIPVANQRRLIRTLLNCNDYLGAAELLRHYARKASRLSDLYAGLAERVDGPSGNTFQPSPPQGPPTRSSTAPPPTASGLTTQVTSS